jgi:hypothetical protein
MKKISSLSLALISFLAFAGCKKDTTPAKTNCKINEIVFSLSDGKVAYNPDGKIKSISYGSNGSLISYAYSSDSIVITVDNERAYVYTLNADGRPKNLVMESYAQNCSYQYSDGELSRAIVTSSAGNSDYYSFTWKNGNIASVTDPFNNTTTFDYYTDKSYQPGDYFYFFALDKLVEARTPYPYLLDIQLNKNLLKSFIQGGMVTTPVTYNFDAEGKITSMNRIISGLSTLTYYKYDCR